MRARIAHLRHCSVVEQAQPLIQRVTRPVGRVNCAPANGCSSNWLGYIAPITSEKEQKYKKKCSNRTRDNEKNRPHVRVFVEGCNCRIKDVRHDRNREQGESSPGSTQPDGDEDVGSKINRAWQAPTCELRRRATP